MIVPKDGQTTAPRIRALGKDYHPPCFKCEVFYSPRNPRGNPRRSRGQNCYQCEEDKDKLKTGIILDVFLLQDCGMVLDSRIKGKECYPIKSHVLCVKCNRRRQSESEESDSE